MLVWTYALLTVAVATASVSALYYWREIRPLRKKLYEIEDLCCRTVIRRLTWVAGDMSRVFPDMIIVEGEGWLYEPYMDPAVSHSNGDVPVAVRKCFMELATNPDRALKVLEMFRGRSSGIKYTRIDCSGVTLFMGLPVRNGNPSSVPVAIKK